MYIFLMPFLFIGLIILDLVFTYFLYSSSRKAYEDCLDSVNDLSKAMWFNIHNLEIKIDRCDDEIKGIKTRRRTRRKKVSDSNEKSDSK